MIITVIIGEDLKIYAYTINIHYPSFPAVLTLSSAVLIYCKRSLQKGDFYNHTVGLEQSSNRGLFKESFQIGHFRVHFSLCFKAKLSVRSLLWRSVFIYIETGANYPNKNFALWKRDWGELGSGLLFSLHQPLFDASPSSTMGTWNWRISVTVSVTCLGNFVAGSVTSCSVSCKLSRYDIARQVA